MIDFMFVPRKPSLGDIGITLSACLYNRVRSYRSYGRTSKILLTTVAYDLRVCNGLDQKSYKQV